MLDAVTEPTNATGCHAPAAPQQAPAADGTRAAQLTAQMPPADLTKYNNKCTRSGPKCLSVCSAPVGGCCMLGGQAQTRGRAVPDVGTAVASDALRANRSK